MLMSALKGKRGQQTLALAKKLAQQMVQRRKNRIGAGQPVAFNGIRRRRIRRGRPLPIAPPNRPVQNSARTKMPVSSSMQMASHQVGVMPFSRTEPAFNVEAKSTQNGIISPSESLLYLIPTNPQIFSAAAGVAIQYQYYRWKYINISYVPNTAFDTSGMITLAVVPSVTKAAEIYQVSDLLQLRDYLTFSAKSGASFRITPDMLNKTFTKMGYEVEPYSDIDLTQQQYVQGVLAIGYDGFTSDTDDDIIGTLMVSYEVELIAPLSSTIPTTTTVDVHALCSDVTQSVDVGANHTSTAVASYLSKWNQPSFLFEPDGHTSYDVTARHRLPYLFTVAITPVSGSAGTPAYQATAVEHATIHSVDAQTGSNGAGYATWLIVPNRHNSVVNFSAAGTLANSARISYHCHYISPREVSRLLTL